MLKEKLRQVPGALQKLIVTRGIIAVVSLLLFVVVLCITADFRFAFPCLALALYLIANMTFLVYNCIRNRFVTVSGICAEVECTAVRKRVKTISAKVDDKILAVRMKHKMKPPSVGDEIILYLSEKTPVYEKDGGYCIYDFYAIEIIRKV